MSLGADTKRYSSGVRTIPITGASEGRKSTEKAWAIAFYSCLDDFNRYGSFLMRASRIIS